MLSPCTFVIIIAFGCFFVDKKTRNEVVDKCKKNKFMILGGLILFYFIFLHNRVEGMKEHNMEEHTMEGMENYPDELYTTFISNLCYGVGEGASESFYLLNQHLVDSEHPKLSRDDQTQCFLNGISRRSQIEPHLLQAGGGSSVGGSPGGSLYVTP